jgi:transcriptional regulator with XRE-family HTH domain
VPKKPQLSDVDETLRQRFGERVAMTRAKLGIRPGEFAAAGGISMAHQYRIEAGERTAEVLYVQRLAQRFGDEVIESLFGLRAADSASVVSITGDNNIAAGRDVKGSVAGGKRKA